MEAKCTNAAAAAAAAAAGTPAAWRGAQVIAEATVTAEQVGPASCGRLAAAGLTSLSAAEEAQRLGIAARCSRELCAAHGRSGPHGALRSFVTYREAASLPQPRHSEKAEERQSAGREDRRCASRNRWIMAPRHTPVGPPLNALTTEGDASARAPHHTLPPSQTTFPAPTTVQPPREAPATAKSSAGIPNAAAAATREASESPLTAGTRAMGPAAKATQGAAIAASTWTAAEGIEVCRPAAPVHQTDGSVSGLYHEGLSDFYRTDCCALRATHAKQGRQALLQLTYSITSSSESGSRLYDEASGTDSLHNAHGCAEGRPTVAAEVPVPPSGVLSSATARRDLSADTGALRVATSAAGTADLLPAPRAAACVPTPSCLSAATHSAEHIARPPTAELENRRNIDAVPPACLQVQLQFQLHQRQQQQTHYSADAQPHPPLGQCFHRQLTSNGQRDPYHEQLRRQAPEQHQYLRQQQHQPQIQAEQQAETQIQHQGQSQELLLQQRVYMQQDHQLERQREHQQCPRHKPIRLFLLEDYEGPELPPAESLVSLCFGTSSEEEEELEQQHEAAAARGLPAHVAPPVRKASPANISTAASGAALKKKKKRERKISVGATDSLWQPHFHPHNQEFRVRYRYKGSMRLKTLSCARYGREGARRLTAAFVQRWQKSGRRVAAKTHRSKLALSDLPRDIHLLPVYDKKRPTTSTGKRSIKSASGPYVCDACSADAISYSCGSDKSTSNPRSRCSCSESNSDVSGGGRRIGAQDVKSPAASSQYATTASQAPEEPARAGLSLPVRTRTPPIAPLQEPPSSSCRNAAAAAPSAVSTCAAGERAPGNTLSDVPVANTLLCGCCAPFWSPGAGSCTAGYAGDCSSVVRSKDGPPLCTTTGNCSNTTMLSWKASHIFFPLSRTACGPELVSDAGAGSSHKTGHSSSAAVVPRGPTSGHHENLPTKGNSNYPLLRFCCRLTERCSATTAPLHSSTVNCSTSAKRVADSDASSAAATEGGGNTDEPGSAANGANSIADPTGHYGGCFLREDADTRTCLPPLRVPGHSGDSPHELSPAASAAAFSAKPDGSPTALIPRQQLQSCSAAATALSSDANALPTVPAACVFASSDAQVPTATQAAPRCASLTLGAASEDPAVARAAPAAAAALLPARVENVPAATAHAEMQSPARSIVPARMLPEAAAAHLRAATPAPMPAGAASTVLNYVAGPAVLPATPGTAEKSNISSARPDAAPSAAGFSTAATQAPGAESAFEGVSICAPPEERRPLL